MCRRDVKNTLPRDAAVTLQSIVELEAALQSGGPIQHQQDQKSEEKE